MSIYSHILFFFLLPKFLFSQGFITIAGSFNDLHYNSIPENRNLTLDENTELRRKFKIKGIVKKNVTSDSYYTDPLIRLDPVKNLTYGHVSTIEYFFYNTEGLLSGKSMVPLNIRLSKKDSTEIRFVRTQYDSTQKTYRIDYFYVNKLTQRKIYLEGILKEEHSFGDEFNTTLYDEYNKERDTTCFCDSYIHYEYNEQGLIRKRIYNNPNYYSCKDFCSIIESETYEYKPQELIITKIPYRDTTYTTERYINKIKFNKNAQIQTSTFCLNKTDDPWVIFSCLYDKHYNLKSVYESWDVSKPLSYKRISYRNKYDKKGRLLSITHKIDKHKKIFYFDASGLLTKIEGKEEKNTGYCYELFEYSFY